MDCFLRVFRFLCVQKSKYLIQTNIDRMKRNMTLKSLLLVVCALSGNVFGQSTLSNGKLVYNYPFAPSEGIVNRMERNIGRKCA